ncbi:hypothetical protein BBD39_06160 [Arsenophonus endosymbiont of Bemisia tabaci Asia II 3]|nr:hypothetical protein BBD39_06160 [Arsenophonus endosymbiont of Bemisia tabaci Asia II 3]
MRVAERERIEAVREVESLRGKMAQAEAGAGGGAGTAGAGAKRKRGGESVISFERDGKKPRRDGTERREVFLGKVVVEEIEGEGEGCELIFFFGLPNCC